MNWCRPISGFVVLVSLGGWLVSGTPPGGPSSTSLALPESPDLARLREEGNRLFAAQRYEEASGIYLRGYRESLGRRQIRPAVRFLNNLAGCEFALSRYQKAVELYQAAQRLARPIRFAEMLGMISLNLAGIYLQMGDASAAAQAAEQGIRDLRDLPNVYFRAKLLGQFGNARGWSGQFEEALSTLIASQREADRVNDLPTLAVTLDYSGIHCLRRGDLAGAEAAFLKAYLVRRLRKPDEIHLSQANLGRLRLAQGDFKSAETLFSLALAKANSAPSLVQVWTLYHGRGAARQAQGRFDEAWADFGTAVDLARRWRPDAVAADAMRIRTDAGLHEVYQSYIRAGNRAALSSGRPEMARRAFSAAEEHRAVSLREQWNASGEWRRKLPEEYGPVLGQLQSAEIAALRNNSAPAAARAARLRLRLIEMEAQTGVPRPLAVAGGGVEFSRAIQLKLSPSEALLSFEFGEKESYLWA
ncbi:MAG: tetratricopeptide repeat protein, partial [Acidobacteriota bacterium]